MLQSQPRLLQDPHVPFVVLEHGLFLSAIVTNPECIQIRTRPLRMRRTVQGSNCQRCAAPHQDCLLHVQFGSAQTQWPVEAVDTLHFFELHVPHHFNRPLRLCTAKLDKQQTAPAWRCASLAIGSSHTLSQSIVMNCDSASAGSSRNGSILQ